MKAGMKIWGKRGSILMAAIACLVFFCVTAVIMSAHAAPVSDTHEPDDHHYEAKLLALNAEAQEHTFGDAADEDWLCFHGVKDQIYYLGTTENPGKRCNTVFELYNVAGESIDNSIGSFADTRFTGYGEAEQVAWRCPADGTYYLRVMQEDPSVFGDGTQYAVYLWDGMGPLGEVPVRGKVTHSVTGKPIQGTRVRLSTPSGVAVGSPAVTDSKGRFQLSATEGKYTLQVRATGYKVQTRLITVKGDSVETQFALEPATVSKADLAVSGVSVPASAQPGDTINVKSTIANKGDAASGKFNFTIYLSEVPRVDFGRSRLLKTIRLTNLEPGASSLRKTVVSIPSDHPPGTYRIVVSVDQAGAVAESTKTNNVKASVRSLAVE